MLVLALVRQWGFTMQLVGTWGTWSEARRQRGDRSTQQQPLPCAGAATLSPVERQAVPEDTPLG